MHDTEYSLLLLFELLEKQAVPIMVFWPLARFVHSIVLTLDRTLYRKRFFKKDYFDGYNLRSYANWSILLWYVPSRPRLPNNNNSTFTPPFFAITLTNLAKIGEWASLLLVLCSFPITPKLDPRAFHKLVCTLQSHPWTRWRTVRGL